MTDHKHTPGPWRVMPSEREDWDGWFSVIDPALASPDLAVCTCSYSGGDDPAGTAKAWSYEALGRSRAVANANAHLIAAAPDMYEALRAVVKMLNFEQHAPRPQIEAAIAALAKADGK